MHLEDNKAPYSTYVDVDKCHVCSALVERDNMDDHLEWHSELHYQIEG